MKASADTARFADLLGEFGAQVTLLEYLGQVDAIVIRRDAPEKTAYIPCCDIAVRFRS